MRRGGGLGGIKEERKGEKIGKEEEAMGRKVQGARVFGWRLGGRVRTKEDEWKEGGADKIKTLRKIMGSL